MALVIDDTIVGLTLSQLREFKPKQIQETLQLLSEGNTVPFIARYRKERTGSLDEVQIRQIEETYAFHQNLEARKADVLRLIDEQGKLTEDLAQALKQASKLQEIEDLYRPYKQKRQTKASLAKEKGLEPLAQAILAQGPSPLEDLALAYVDADKGVESLDEALSGASDIIAEQVSDAAKYRDYLRKLLQEQGRLSASLKDKEADPKAVYENYYDYDEAVAAIKEHRVLALNRGEKEGVLKVTLSPLVDQAQAYLEHQVLTSATSPAASLIRSALEDAYKRLIFPSLEREIRSDLSQQADQQAIQVFGDNLKNLLLQPPMKDNVILGLDPAYRTGCKLAVIDATGRVLDKGVIYPHKPAPEAKRQAAAGQFKALLTKHKVSLIAIGNGTASRESEQFVADVLKTVDAPIQYVIVSEAGASVYSASDLAREEFPDYQVEERSAVSIARRLQDPLAELVKIDPQSVGVGQYQHDVSQKALKSQLDFVVETVVNQVGVNLNTASVSLLSHVAGLNKTIATNIVTYRDEHGAFKNRQELKAVKRLGPKAFEQAAGFLRIVNGEDVLDNTPIHPEAYAATRSLLATAHIRDDQVGQAEALQGLTSQPVTTMMAQTGLGKETIVDILKALEQPGRDIRDQYDAPILRSDVMTMADLQVGMQLQGTVRNVVDFGAFVDIGVKEDGLVHLSKINHRFIKHPSEVLAVGDIVTVWIDGIDLAKGRISLTMVQEGDKPKKTGAPAKAKAPKDKQGGKSQKSAGSSAKPKAPRAKSKQKPKAGLDFSQLIKAKGRR